MAALLELAAQVGVVVDLAVLNHAHGPVGADHGLVPALEVDDRQAPRSERDRPLHVHAGVVGAAVDEHARHGLHGLAVGGTPGPRGDAADAAHQGRR